MPTRSPATRWRPQTTARPTHFISIPLISSASRPQFERSVLEFRRRLGSVQTRNGQRLVPDEAVKPVGSLHLTIGVLHLHNEEAFRRAATAIEELDLTGFLARVGGGGTPLPNAETNNLVIPQFKISSLPLIRRGQESQSSKAYVVHLDPYDPDGRLHRFCDAILEHFRERGLMQRPDPARPHPRDQLTLHATLINMRQKRPSTNQWRRSGGAEHGLASHESGQEKFDRETVKPIDVSSVLETFGSWKWAENVRLDRVAMCEMGCKYDWDDRGELVDGHYEEVKTRPIDEPETG